MRIMCGVFGHMGREDFGCNQKIKSWPTRLNLATESPSDRINFIQQIFLSWLFHQSHPMFQSSANLAPHPACNTGERLT
jgi:hypothetical protein